LTLFEKYIHFKYSNFSDVREVPTTLSPHHHQFIWKLSTHGGHGGGATSRTSFSVLFSIITFFFLLEKKVWKLYTRSSQSLKLCVIWHTLHCSTRSKVCKYYEIWKYIINNFPFVMAIHPTALKMVTLFS